MVQSRAFSFLKKDRLIKTADFRTAVAQGRRISNAGFTVYIRENSANRPRLGIAVSRKAGEATRRNRLKRLIREFFRINKDHLPGNCDILVVCRPECQVDDLAATTRELGAILFPLAKK